MVGQNILKARKNLRAGRCSYCKGAIRRGWVCLKKRCRRKYATAYARDNRRVSNLKLIVERMPDPKNEAHVIEVLSCGHAVKRFRSLVPNAKRRKCPKCEPAPRGTTIF